MLITSAKIFEFTCFYIFTTRNAGRYEKQYFRTSLDYNPLVLIVKSSSDICSNCDGYFLKKPLQG